MSHWDIKSFEEWRKLKQSEENQDDVKRLFLEYLISGGYRETAKRFQEEAGLEPKINLNLLEDRVKIRDLVLNGRISDAIDLVNQLSPDLLKNNKTLLFNLQKQRLIEMIRDKKINEALEFAQTTLAETVADVPDGYTQLEKILVLLAYEKPETCPYASFLQLAQREKLAKKLNSVICKHVSDTDEAPKLLILIKLICNVYAKLSKNLKEGDSDEEQS